MFSDLRVYFSKAVLSPACWHMPRNPELGESEWGVSDSEGQPRLQNETPLGKKKKQTREKIIPHPLNVSVSREDPGGRDQMGISKAEFLARGKKMMAVQERKEEQRESWKSTRMLRPATQRQQWRLGPAKHKHQPGSKSPSYRHVSPLLWFLPTPVWVSYVTQTRWNSNSWFSILDADSNHIKSGVVFAGLVKAAILLWVHGCRLCHIQGYQLAAGALVLF